MAEFQEQQEQRGVHRSHLCNQGALLPASDRGTPDLRKTGARLGTGKSAVRAGHARHAGPFFGADAAARARKFEPLFEDARRSEEHTSELQSLMRISYAVFCLKKKNTLTISSYNTHNYI